MYYIHQPWHDIPPIIVKVVETNIDKNEPSWFFGEVVKCFKNDNTISTPDVGVKFRLSFNQCVPVPDPNTLIKDLL